jgi:PST family polysaccharide transporter
VSKPLGHTFGRGMSLYAISAVAARIASFASQIVLGVLLLEAEFGIFAAAFGVAAFTGALRAGGVQQVLQTFTGDRFEREVGAYAQLSFAAGLLGAVATAIAAIVVPDWYGAPSMRAVLLVLAAGMLLGSASAVFRSRLQSRLDFAYLARVDLVNAFVRAGSAVAVAFAGGGALAFAVPILVVALVEVAAFGLRSKLPWSAYAASRSDLLSAWRTVRWTLLVTIASTVVYQGDYLAASLFVSKEVLGVYFFVYALCNQPMYLVTGTLGELIAPVVSRLRDQPERLSAAVLRIARALGVFLPFAAFGVPVLLPELDRLVWGGKWAAAAWPGMLLSLEITFLITTTLLYGGLNAIGAFRAAGIIECLRAAAILLGAGAGAWWFGTTLGIAAGVLVVAGGTSALASVVVLRRFGASIGQAAASVFVGPLVAAVVAVLLRIGLDRIAGWSGADSERRLLHAVEFVAAAAAYGVVVLLVLRTCFRRTIHDAISILPARVARLAARVVGAPPTAVT